MLEGFLSTAIKMNSRLLTKNKPEPRKMEVKGAFGKSEQFMFMEAVVLGPRR